MATKLFYTGPARDRRAKVTPVGVGSIAQMNRHTKKPHKHRREIARNARQSA